MPMYKPTQITLAESAPGHYMHTRDPRPQGGVSQVRDAEMCHFASSGCVHGYVCCGGA